MRAPGRRQAHRVTRTVPNSVASSLRWPVSSRLRVIPSAPVAALPRSRAASLLPHRPQVQVVLHHLPLHLPAPPGEQLFELAAVSPPAPGPCSSATSAVNKSTEAAKGPVPGIGAYGSIGLFFRSGFVMGWHLRT